jgi:hypothetical protein
MEGVKVSCREVARTIGRPPVGRECHPFACFTPGRAAVAREHRGSLGAAPANGSRRPLMRTREEGVRYILPFFLGGI